MLRLTFLMRRRPDLSIEEFQSYWRDHHGPLMASFATDLDVLRYVQAHTIADEDHSRLFGRRGQMEAPYDGVAEMWFENREALVASTQTKQGRRAGAMLIEDEARFIDLPNSPMWLGHEFPQVNPTPENIVARPRSTTVKLYFPLRTHAGRDERDAQQYWYSNHGPIIRRQAAGAGIARYVQVHRVPDELEAGLRERRGVVVDGYMGHAELWFDRSALAFGSPERAEANARAIEDESKFIDFKRSCMWLAKEHVFVDHM